MDADESVVRTFKALADQVGLAILEFFWGPEAEKFRTEEGICASDVRDFLGVTQPAVSDHMRILVGAGLVVAEKRGKRVFYECLTEGPGETIRYLDRFRRQAPAAVPSRPRGSWEAARWRVSFTKLPN